MGVSLGLSLTPLLCFGFFPYGGCSVCGLRTLLGCLTLSFAREGNFLLPVFYPISFNYNTHEHGFMLIIFEEGKLEIGETPFSNCCLKDIVPTSTATLFQ